jgi:hypothetical protein
VVLERRRLLVALPPGSRVGSLPGPLSSLVDEHGAAR